MLKLRLIFGFLLSAGLAAVLLLDGALSTRPPAGPADRWLHHGALTTALVAVLAALAVEELVRFARGLQCHAYRRVAHLGVLGLVAGPYVIANLPLAGPLARGWEILLLAVVLALAFLAQAQRHRTHQVMVNVGTTLLIVLYAGGLAHFWVRLRMDVPGASGATALLFSVFIVKLADIGAYFTGSAIGRHKLIPWLSPGKTWEGLAGGVAAAVIVAVLLGHTLSATGALPLNLPPARCTFELLVFGLLMAGLSVLGDLAESLLKRDVALKDSGKALPGFGGVLDVLDSPLLAAPAMWLFWTRLLGAASA